MREVRQYGNLILSDNSFKKFHNMNKFISLGMTKCGIDDNSPGFQHDFFFLAYLSVSPEIIVLTSDPVICCTCKG